MVILFPAQRIITGFLKGFADMDDEDANLFADGETQQRAKRRRTSRDEDVEGPA